MDNHYESAARERKAFKLAACLHRAGITSERLAKLIERGDGFITDSCPEIRTELDWWRFACAEAGTNVPSDESKRVVLEALKGMECQTSK